MEQNEDEVLSFIVLSQVDGMMVWIASCDWDRLGGERKRRSLVSRRHLPEQPDGHQLVQDGNETQRRVVEASSDVRGNVLGHRRV